MRKALRVSLGPLALISCSAALAQTSIVVLPSSRQLTAGQTQQYTASISGASASNVVWSLSPSTAATAGTISTTGLYTAPSKITGTTTVRVLATTPTGAGTATLVLNPTVTVQIFPGAVSVAPGARQQFNANITGTTNTGVTWSLNPALGTISSTGLYSAPASVPADTTVTLRAVSAADPSKSAQATIALPAIGVVVTPGTAALTAGRTQQFAASVTGTADKSVSWSINPSVGTISAAGLYTAPATVSEGQSVTVVATSNADRTRIGQSTVTVQPPVSISLAPASVTLAAGETQQFTPTVGGLANPTVRWSVNGTAGGNETVGTVSAVGLYAAPATPMPPFTATVKATALVDATVFAESVVRVQSPVAVTVAPAAIGLFSGQKQQFTATLAGGVGSSGVTWSMAGSTPAGSVSSTGLYTAPSSISALASVTVKATSVEDPARSGSATITLRPGVDVSVTPSAVNLLSGGSQQFTAAVAGSSNTAVTWSLSSPVGTISATGMYHAPAAAAGRQTVTVIATSASDLTKSAQAVVGISEETVSLNGGLVSLPEPVNGANLLSNAGFEQGKAGWSDNGFTVDTTVAHQGLACLRLTNANLSTYSVSAANTIQLKKGVYNFGGWVKIRDLATAKGFGVRFCLHAPVAYPWSLVSTCTDPVKGTADWQYLQVKNITVPQDTPAALYIDGYGGPDGTAWFDDISLARMQYPLQTYMLYPNYRGVLFDDQSQVAKFHITIEPPAGDSATDFVLNGQVKDEESGATLMENSFPTALSLTASFDLSRLLTGHAYLVTFQMSKPDGTQRYSYPAYRVVKVPGSLRDSMVVSFDEENRFVIHGRPSFLLGVYDSGLPFTTNERSWEDIFTSSRRLFELPINFYLNYWYGSADNSSMIPMMNVLARHGINNITNANCVTNGAVSAAGAGWFLNRADFEIQQRTAHPAFGGFYAADECIPSLVPNVFGHYQRMKVLGSGGIALGTLLPNSNVPLWRDTLDVVATDPYPLYGKEPAGGYALSTVANATAAAGDAVMRNRPALTVIQFFQFTSLGRWPTHAELRSMSYGAIAGGANGLFYWSVGAGALAYICDGRDAYHSPAGSPSWCPARLDNFANLKAVMTEIKGLEPVLVLPDEPGLLTSNSNSAIRTRIKFDGTTAYLIAYNASSSTQSATFQWSQALHTISVAAEARNLTPSGSGFADTFAPNGVHVYTIR